MEKKNIGLVALLAGVAAASNVQADEVNRENPFVTTHTEGVNTQVAGIQCSPSDYLLYSKDGMGGICN
jgi:uncharacterized protein YxeA